MHASSGIRTYDPSVRAGEDCLCLRSRGHVIDSWSVYLIWNFNGNFLRLLTYIFHCDPIAFIVVLERNFIHVISLNIRAMNLRNSVRLADTEFQTKHIYHQLLTFKYSVPMTCKITWRQSEYNIYAASKWSVVYSIFFRQPTLFNIMAVKHGQAEATRNASNISQRETLLRPSAMSH
jgi:hypothetical protein